MGDNDQNWDKSGVGVILLNYCLEFSRIYHFLRDGTLPIHTKAYLDVTF